jgi:hypothetical protein
MPVLNGHPSASAVFTPVAVGAGGGIPIGGPTVQSSPHTMQTNAMVVDGTPVRVVVYALAAAAGIFALRLAGFKFNVGVSA